MNRPIQIVIGWKAVNVPAGGAIGGRTNQLWRVYDAVARIAPSKGHDLTSSTTRSFSDLDLSEISMGPSACNAVVREGVRNALPFDPYQILIDSRMERNFDMTLRSANVYKPPWRGEP